MDKYSDEKYKYGYLTSTPIDPEFKVSDTPALRMEQALHATHATLDRLTEGPFRLQQLYVLGPQTTVYSLVRTDDAVSHIPYIKDYTKIRIVVKSLWRPHGDCPVYKPCTPEIFSREWFQSCLTESGSAPDILCMGLVSCLDMLGKVHIYRACRNKALDKLSEWTLSFALGLFDCDIDKLDCEEMLLRYTLDIDNRHVQKRLGDIERLLEKLREEREDAKMKDPREWEWEERISATTP